MPHPSPNDHDSPPLNLPPADELPEPHVRKWAGAIRLALATLASAALWAIIVAAWRSR